MTYEKVTPGQKLKTTPIVRGSFINDTVDLVNAYNEGRLPSGRRSGAGIGSRALVEVRNSTGGDRLRGDVVQLVGHLLDEVSEDHPWFDAELVDEPVMRLLGVLTRAVKEDEIGTAQLAGVCLLRVNVTDIAHTHARPVDDDEECISAYGGPFELLMVPDEPGHVDLWVLIDNNNRPRLGKANGDIDKGTGVTDNVSLYAGIPGSEVDTNTDFTAFNKFGDIDSGAWVLCLNNGCGWYIAQAECPT